MAYEMDPVPGILGLVELLCSLNWKPSTPRPLVQGHPDILSGLRWFCLRDWYTQDIKPLPDVRMATIIARSSFSWLIVDNQANWLSLRDDDQVETELVDVVNERLRISLHEITIAVPDEL